MKTLVNFVLFLILLCANTVFAQTTKLPGDPERSSFSLGIKGGYDHPLFKVPFEELNYKGSRYLGLDLDYTSPINLGLRLNYSNILTRPSSPIGNSVFYGSTNMATTRDSKGLNRHFVGIGPSYRQYLSSERVSILVAPMIGYSWLSGGDAMVDSQNPLSGTDVHMLNTGFTDNTLAFKGDVELKIGVTKRLDLNLGAYYMRHFKAHFDNSLDLSAGTTMTIAHFENDFDHSSNPYALSGNPPMVLMNGPDDKHCLDLQSVGINIGVSYKFGNRKPVEVKEDCNNCCPDDKHKVVVTVRDEHSGKVIPGADVAIKDLYGNIVSTGTTNSFGVVDFGMLPHNNYSVVGQVFGIETTTDAIAEDEFLPDAVIQKEVLYTDLRFILKGITINKTTRQREPGVVVSLTSEQTGSVAQDNSNATGEFMFRLDKNSSYEVVGTKAGKLSEIERASTIGLTRSTTLFVDLELGVEDFDCGLGTILDIKYEFDKWNLLPASKFELDRIVRYMNDHQVARIELSSHTDSRGSHAYNDQLSEKRAKSAVDYIVSKGISPNRIIARGYGERRLLNQCADGVDCPEAMHTLNRRTEAKLICQ